LPVAALAPFHPRANGARGVASTNNLWNLRHLRIDRPLPE
jgi:hypothetical protein